MSFDPSRPYNDLPPLPPSIELETRTVLKACIGARAALAELKQAGALLPNQGLLINTLPLMEAKDSSEIENIVTTTDKLFQFANEQSQADPATKEALRYRTALYEGFISLKSRPLSTSTAMAVCSTIKGVDMDIRRVPGTTITNTVNQEIIYTPPVGGDAIRNLLTNWENFIHNSHELDPLIVMEMPLQSREDQRRSTQATGLVVPSCCSTGLAAGKSRRASSSSCRELPQPKRELRMVVVDFHIGDRRRCGNRRPPTACSQVSPAATRSSTGFNRER